MNSLILSKQLKNTLLREASRDTIAHLSNQWISCMLNKKIKMLGG